MSEEKNLLKAITEDPDQIQGFTAEQVEEARTALREFYAQVKAGEIDRDREAMAAAKELSEALTARETAIAEEQAEFDAELAELEKSLGIEEETEEPEAEVEEAPAEEVEVPDTPAEIVEEESVTASAEKPKANLKALSNAVPKERKPREEKRSLVASAGERVGARFTDRLEVGSYMKDAWRGSSNGTFNIMSFGTEEDPIKHRYNLTDSPSTNAGVLAEVVRNAQEEGNLVASGGFCAPAEVMYDFFNIASVSGIVQLPTVGAPRGSVSIPVSPSLGDFLGVDGIASVWDNSTDITPGENTKPVFTVDCPENTTCEVAAYATILQFGNFGARFYPENVANATALAAVATERVINAAAITALQGASTAVSVAGSSLAGGGIVNLAQVLAAQSAEYRQTYGMSPDAALDLIAPHWLDDALFADAIARDSTTEYQDVARKIRGIFSELNLRVQFVYDYQTLAAGGFFPSTADVLLMAPGTAVRLDGGTLDLGIVRDSTLNATNDYQTFVEEFVGWCFPGHEVREIEDIPVCPSGGTGDRASLVCATSS